MMSTSTAPLKARSDATRRALLDAGLSVFGRDGYAATSMRTLAQQAGVNQALIAYHFGGKQGLYLAVFEDVAGELGRRLAPILTECGAGQTVAVPGDSSSSRQSAVTRAVTLVCGLAHVLTRPDMAVYARLIIREQMDPSEAFLALWQGGIGRLVRSLTEQVALAQGHDTPNETHRLTALTLAGQAVIFRVARATVSHHLDWPQDYDDSQIAQLEALLESNVRAILNSPEVP